MKEIHAYRNEDGTYRVRIVHDDTCYGEQWYHVGQDIPRAQIDIKPLEDQGSGKIFDIQFEDIDDEDEYI